MRSGDSLRLVGMLVLYAVVLAGGEWTTGVAAQARTGAAARPRPASTFTGYELALDGTTAVRAGEAARFHGVAYQVRGLAELVPFEGRVRARFARSEGDEGGRWVTASSDADGHFVVDVPIPLRDETHTATHVEVEVGPDGSARRFETTVQVRSAFALMLRSDRELYEPGEPVHLWMLLTDMASNRPVVGREIELTISGGPLSGTRRTVSTAESGVAHVELAIPESAPSGSVVATAHVVGHLHAEKSFTVGTRTWERLLATVEMAEDEVAPNGSGTAMVHVTTPSGAPVRDADVSVEVGQATYTGQTDRDGRAAIVVVAPAYHRDDASRVGVRATIVHPAHGSVIATTTLRLAVPLTLEIEAIAESGGLVPEVDGTLFVRLSDGAGDPPASGTEVTVTGPAIRGGTATATTDVHGFAEVPTRVPLGAAAGYGDPRTLVRVSVTGPLERTATLTVPVPRDSRLATRLSRVVAEPGDTVEVELSRRPSIARNSVLVTLLDDRGAPLHIVYAGPRERTVRIVLPRDRLGLFSVVARPVLGGENHLGPGTSAALIIRPAQPDFFAIAPERQRWVVGETARVRLTTAPGNGRVFGAVLVRDLSAHGGEVPFTRTFLDRAFDRAILDPSTPEADRLLRAALAAHSGGDALPEQAPPLVDALGLAAGQDSGAAPFLLRDPFPLSRELSRRGVAAAMRLAEERLTTALDAGALDEVSTTSGRARRFRDDLFAGEDMGTTLGGGELTPAILEASDPSFNYDTVARRVARARLVRAMAVLALYLDPGDEASPTARMAAREPSERWLPRIVERRLLSATMLDDPWGGRFVLRRTARPSVVLSARATDLELVSPGPDGRPGTADDVRDPFARVVSAGTPYALASGEDELMRALAILSPLTATLAAIRDSYRRVSAEMTEELIGDAVGAEVSEGTLGLGGLGLIGTGGGGSGSGYGSGSGGFSGRTARVPSIRMGSAGVSGLAGIVRERFPPTLLFVPSILIDDSGTTDIEIPLADTVTTYLVEAIVWRDDGWVWSESTRIEVDRDIVVDAPIPEMAHRGDRVRLPLRVSNRGTTPREIVLRLLGDEALGIPDSEAHRLSLAPGDAEMVPVEIDVPRVGRGQLTVVATTPDGEAVDAVRRQLRVVALSRRVTVTRDVVADGDAEVVFEIPEGAHPTGASLWIGTGPLVFGEDPSRDRWEWSAPRAALDAFALGTMWGDDLTSDHDVAQTTMRISADLDRTVRNLSTAGEDGEDHEGVRLRVEAWTLIGLSPITETPDARPILEPQQFIARLRRDVASHAVALADDPEAWVLAAAALGFSMSGPRGRAQIAELLRRARRHTVEVGDDVWLATEQRAVRSTVLWAMAELSVGRRDQTLAILSTLGRWVAAGNVLSVDERGLSAAVMSRLMDGRQPETIEVSVDGRARRVHLEHGAADLDAPELARSGAHRIVARVPRGSLVAVHAAVRYGIGWRHPAPEPGPLVLSFEGRVGTVEEVAELELVVRNRSPRTLAQPVVEIELPTGAELTARDRGRIAAHAREVRSAEGVLRVTLGPMPPGAERRVPIPLRWSVDGKLKGLGVAAWALDRPEGVTILRPRVVALDEAER